MNNTTDVEIGPRHAAAILVPCSSRKSVRALSQATAVSLRKADQGALETAWLERLANLVPVRPASSLYAGRGFKLARQAATASGGALHVVSAGLGLVAADRPVPAYGLTVGRRGDESIGARVVGRFDEAAWWRSVSAGPFSTGLASLFEKDSSLPVLIALTQPYARLFAPSLEGLSDALLTRVRIVGLNLAGVLPQGAVRQLLPYDGRLESLLPGTKADFSQRALLHFARDGLYACPDGDTIEHRRWVEAALAGRSAPRPPARRCLSDAEIIGLIERHLPETRGIGRLLRVVRHREGVACEQARFSRLYRTAVRTAA